MVPVMNDTKWNELRSAMLEIEPTPRWRSRDRFTGFISGWDGEWYYHFRVGGYDTIDWVEIRPREQDQLSRLVHALGEVGVPGVVGDETVTVFGYVDEGQFVDWL